MSEERVARVNRAVVAAMRSWDTGEPLKAVYAKIILEEMIRCRRMIEVQERRIARLEKSDDRSSGAE